MRLIAFILIGSFLFIIYVSFHLSDSRNAYSSTVDYLLQSFKGNYYYEPDMFASIPEILQRHVGYFETFDVITEDGYVLKVFRLVCEKSKKVVVLQHPLGTDAIVWVSQSNQSLAFILWHLGYEVWLPCNRGTFYSRKHVNVSQEQEQFWNFSFHEIGLYDYSALFQFVKRTNREKSIIFVGHSMATTSALVYASLKPIEAKNLVDLFIMLGPVATFQYSTSPLIYIGKIIDKAAKYNLNLPISGYFLGYDTFYHKVCRLMIGLPIKKFLQLFVCGFCGWTPNEFDSTTINLALSLLPRGCSWKTYLHYSQLANDAIHFRMYNYGVERNLHFYHKTTPPEYPVERIQSPIYFIYSTEDIIANYRDIERFYIRINPSSRAGKLKVSGLNHVDYLYGKNRFKRINLPLITLIERWNA